jgi:RNA-directed DNA polymerase
VDAVRGCRQRCFKRDWVVDLDVRAFFDSVPWELMLKAVARHTTQQWVMLYVERWLKAPMLMSDGTLTQRTRGTPQGGPISPLIANIFLHYGFDSWMVREFPTIWFERFADDVVVHCVTERQAHQVCQATGRRFADIGLRLHPDKTRIVYCKDDRRRLDHDQVTFTFCGYAFRPRKAYHKVRKKPRAGFLPAVAPGKLTDMSRKVASWQLHRRTTRSLDDLAEEVNPVLRSWLNYFTVFYPSAVNPIGKRIDRHLMRWARRKYKRLERSEHRARAWLKGVRQRSPDLFAHWALRYTT